MSFPKLSAARHAQGLAAYRSGQSLMHLIEVAAEIHEMHRTAATEEEHREIENAGPSLIAGFADGLLADVRALAGTTQRSGQKA